jgi:aryl-alcohol dehydrogenase-like predicted oxidoreductase
MIDKIVLGTVQLGLDYGINNQLGKPTLEESFEILNIAFDNGIRILDTAEAYGNSQEVIGLFHKKHPNKKFKVITKLAADHKLEAKSFKNHLNQNIEKLNSDQLFCYMFHDFQSFKKSTFLYKEFLEAKKNGIIEKTGIALYTNEEIECVLNNYSGFDIIQIPFNLFDNDSKRKGFIEKAKAKGIDIHTRSVFLQGLFFYPLNKLPIKLKYLKPYLEKLDVIKNKNNINTQTLALQYVLQKDYVNNVLIGVDSVDQLISNIELCSKKINIPHKEIDSINVKEDFFLNPSNWNL